ncbi:MAG: hypothetical protein OXT67_02820 [Zetaproteobacteria bacterium]|nr:hypothetical protein [Zetaproteobacteria bacterium]
MKVYDVQLKNSQGELVYSSLVPEAHVTEKINTLLSMNEVGEIGAIMIQEKGDISDRYIQIYPKEGTTKGKKPQQ